MSQKKKRTVRHCSEHPKIPAAGRCSVCKAWVCRPCLRRVSGRAYCPRCASKPSSSEKTAVVLPSQPLTPAVSRYPKLYSPVFLAGITLVLCGFVFGIWNMRLIADLSSQNRSLKEKRSELLNQIKERNREIADLQRQLDIFKNSADTSAKKKKSPVIFRSDLNLEPTIGGLPVSFDNGAMQKRLVCLTFDGSDQANAAMDILDTLKSRNLRVTMFLSGRFIRKHADVVRRILLDGHEVGNHTFSHPHLTSYAQDKRQALLPAVTEAYLCRELAKTDSLFRALSGAPLAPIWRAPYGEYNRTLCIWGQRAGYLHIGWRQGKTWKQGLDSNDWIPDEETPGYHTPQEVYDKIIGLARGSQNDISGGIILMHLGTVRIQRDKQVHLMLGRLIDTLQGMNYRIVPVTEMVRESDIDIGSLKHL